MQFSKASYWFIVISILICSITISGCDDWSQSKVQESIKVGNDIVSGLNAYRVDHDDYPDRLGQLVPDYLKQIIQPKAGTREWCYTKYSEKDKTTQFNLRFTNQDDTNRDTVAKECYYLSRVGKWQKVDESF